MALDRETWLIPVLMGGFFASVGVGIYVVLDWVVPVGAYLLRLWYSLSP